MDNFLDPFNLQTCQTADLLASLVSSRVSRVTGRTRRLEETHAYTQ